ncbi:hypothetical protein L873DRAFT_1806172 [Choiromyces venosus 120613-1]|uniref:HTH luxR-type domain-containing protein n=1 Tax=Choiromyces venosus 120613-1 TaxID=1336337 RepID=A0A3N4JRP0_9PEZI|nr:hypothetical protein L873DRAFT_1806172 [Choiromyces venosus 120613-1]
MPQSADGKRRESTKLEHIEVIQLHAEGYTYHQIADCTAISESNIVQKSFKMVNDKDS